MFRAQVSYDAFGTVLDQLRPLAPLDVTAVRSEPPTDLVADATGADDSRLRILVDLGPDGRIETLLVQPTLDDPPDTTEAAAERLAELGTVRLGAFEVDGTRCVPQFDQAATKSAPIGSAFKLYVLGALADSMTYKR